jgi:hypothetical protein
MYANKNALRKKALKASFETNAYICMLIAALFTSIHKWMRNSKQIVMYTYHGNLLRHRKKSVLQHATIQMNLESTRLSKNSQI